LLIVHINEQNVLNCPTVASDPNVVIKCKKKKNSTKSTFGIIPKSTSLVFPWLGTGTSM
jgi:hypothetical protein